MRTAKLFWLGRSQAVRLPREYRFPGDKVRIRRRGNSVILEAIVEDWSWLDEIAGTFDDDFVQAVQEKPGQQDRPALHKAFR
jgi:antitoxin VapB